MKKDTINKQTKEKQEQEQNSFLKIQWKKWRKRIERAFHRIPWRRLFGSLFRRKRLFPALSLLLCFILVCGGMALTVSAAVCDKTEEKIADPIKLAETGEKFDCILILGCRVYEDGRLSEMLRDRVQTGIAIRRLGLADMLIMSGDGRQEANNEPEAMRIEAMNNGVPETSIITDPLGYSTYESVTGLLSAYRGKRVLIVTQEYHLYRALYLAEKLGIKATGIRADQRVYSGQSIRNLREVLARCKDVGFALKKPGMTETDGIR